MFFNYINPVVSLINDKMYKDAVSLYKLMIKKLKELYNISYIISSKEVLNSDIKKSGHGYYVKKLKLS